MSDPIDPREHLATTYLLGQATPEETAEFERLHESDEAFRALVREIESFLAPLNDAVAEEAPPAGLFDEIMDEIDATGAAPAPAPVRSKAGPWRAVAFASMAVAALSLGSHLLPGEPPPAPNSDPLVALLTGETAPNLLVVFYDIDERRVIARASNAAPPADGVWELWLIREGEDGPESLGLLDTPDGERDFLLALDRELSVGTDTLAISLEPPGGSPGDAPTGPILYTGAIDEI